MNNIMLAWRLLYYTYGLLPIVAGLDKYFNYLVNWEMYLNPSIPLHLNMSAAMIMHAVGIIEIAAGLLVLFRPRLGGYVVCGWLLAIAINLISMGHYDIAVRDIAMALSAYVFVLLSKELNK